MNILERENHDEFQTGNFLGYNFKKRKQMKREIFSRAVTDSVIYRQSFAKGPALGQALKQTRKQDLSMCRASNGYESFFFRFSDSQIFCFNGV